MKRMISLCLCAALLITLLGANPVSVSADSRPWLPDPCTALMVSGQYYTTEVYDGVSYDYYIYEAELTIEEASEFEVLYVSALQKQGFQTWNVEDPNLVSCVRISAGTGACAEMGLVPVREDEMLCYGGSAIWWVILAVPENMLFVEGEGAPTILNGETRCTACKGSRTCSYCIGGRCNYGKGYETCIICDGSNVCTICGGRGSY